MWSVTQHTDPTTGPILALDFDGTVLTGDAPVWAYADAAMAAMERGNPSCETSSVTDSIRADLAAFLGGTGDTEYLDGYSAVAALTGSYLDHETLQAAFQASRAALADGLLPRSAPHGLAELLAELGDRVTRVVVTNAPESGVESTLVALGLRNHLDGVFTGVGKPGGWAHVLPELLGGRASHELMAVGDVWENDIRPPLEAGCATALIDRFDHRPGPANVTAATLPDMYDAIRAWADDPAAFARDFPVTTGPVTTGPVVANTVTTTALGARALATDR